MKNFDFLKTLKQEDIVRDVDNSIDYLVYVMTNEARTRQIGIPLDKVDAFDVLIAESNDNIELIEQKLSEFNAIEVS